MSFGGSSSNNAKAVKYTGIQVQTSAYGVTIVVVYGTTRIAPNLGWYGNFKKHVHTSGGKGGLGGGGKGGTTTTTYTADIQLLLCEGPISGINSMWVSQTHLAGSPNFDVGLGAYGQSAWSHLTSDFPNDAYPYSGIAWMGTAKYNLGTSAALPNFNVEAVGIFAGTAPGTYGGNGCTFGGDADPSLVIPDMLTNVHYGVGMPTGLIGQPTSYSETSTIPGTPFRITVAHAATFLFNMSVVDNTGFLYTCVAASPVTGQYSFNAGVYTFAAANAGVSITINYAASTGLTQYKNWCLANGLWISVAYDSATQASSLLQDLATATYSEAVWSSGMLNIIPRGANNVTGNGYTYVAPTGAVVAVNEDDLMANSNPSGTYSSAASDDPLIISRSRISDQVNDVKVEALDRMNQYASTIAEAFDQGLIDQYGRRHTASKTLHMFADVNAANVSAHLQLQDGYVRNRYSLQLDERFCWLDPMDIITVADPQFPSLGAQAIRLLTSQEGDDGTISFTAEQYPVNLGLIPAQINSVGGGTNADFNDDPGLVNTPIFFTVPPSVATNQSLELWVFLSGANQALYGGSQVWVATDSGGPYSLIGDNHNQSRMGVLTTDLPGGVMDPDNTHYVTVDLTQSSGSLSSGTQNDADTGVTLCLVGGVNGNELITFQTAALVTTYSFTLGSYMRRGQYGSKIVDHPPGSQFARLDDQPFRYSLNPSQLGQTLYFKFAAFNVYGGGQQSLAAVPYYAVVVKSPPPPPDVTNFMVTQQGAAAVFTWDKVNDALALKGYAIGYAPVGATLWTQFNILTDAGAGTEMTNADVPPGIWLFGIRAVDIAGQLSTNITTFQFEIYNESNIVYSHEAKPDWLGATLSGFVRHAPQKCITPISTKACDQYIALSPPALPTTGQSAAGALGARTYFVKTTYVTGGAPQTTSTFETLASAEKTQAISANNVLTVTSPAASAQATGYNVYASTTSGLNVLQNASPIPLGTGWTEPTSGLISGASVPSANATGWEWLYGVPDPFVNPFFELSQVDLSFNSSIRLWYTVMGGLLPTVPGSTTLTFKEDDWLDGASDPAVFTTFTFGNIRLRYLRSRLYEDCTTGASYIGGLYIEMDGQPSTVQSVQNVVVGATNTTPVSFPIAFHAPPYVVPTVIGNTALHCTISNVSGTSFIPHVWNTSGVEVGGTISWQATGL